MANVRFYLDSRADKQGEQRIMYSFTYQGNQERKATGIKLKPKFFSMKKQCVLDSHKDAKILNDRLAAIKQAASNMFVQLQIKGTLNEQQVSEKLTEAVRGKKHEATFWGYFEEFLELKSVTWKRSTLDSRKNTFRTLRKFASQTAYPMTFENLNMTFYHRFLAYCFDL